MVIRRVLDNIMKLLTPSLWLKLSYLQHRIDPEIEVYRMQMKKELVR